MSAEPVVSDAEADRLLAALSDGLWHTLAELKLAGVLPFGGVHSRVVRQLLEDGEIERARPRKVWRLRLHVPATCRTSCGRRAIWKSGECALCGGVR